MKSQNIILQAKKLHQQGKSNRSIAKQLKVDHATIAYWIKKDFNVNQKSEIDYNLLDADAYSYVLGMYLGDGYIDKVRRTYRMRINLDAKYPKIIKECVSNIRTILPYNKVREQNIFYKNHLSSITVVVYSNHLPLLFPQHGIGVKHLRRIILNEWQEKIIIPQKLLRGLFHSDGCYVKRYVNGKIISQRYHFSNHSEDILNIWKKYAQQLHIPYTETQYVIHHCSKIANNLLNPFLGYKE